MGLSQNVVTCAVLLLLIHPAHAEETRTVAAEERIFEKLLTQYEDLTYEQFKADIKPQPYLTKLSFDPVSAKYFDRAAAGLKLNDQERAIFRRNGFVSVDHDQRYSFASAYYGIYTRDLPV